MNEMKCTIQTKLMFHSALRIIVSNINIALQPAANCKNFLNKNNVIHASCVYYTFCV